MTNSSKKFRCGSPYIYLFFYCHELMEILILCRTKQRNLIKTWMQIMTCTIFIWQFFETFNLVFFFFNFYKKAISYETFNLYETVKENWIFISEKYNLIRRGKTNCISIKIYLKLNDVWEKIHFLYTLNANFFIILIKELSLILLGISKNNVYIFF